MTVPKLDLVSQVDTPLFQNRMNIKRFRHIAIIVRSMDAMLSFYQNILGFRIKRDSIIDSPKFQKGIGIPGASARCVHLELPESTVELELFEFAQPDKRDGDHPAINDSGFRHIALVVQNLEATVGELKQKGVAFHSPPIRFEAPKEIRGFKFVYLKDPEGNFIELNELPEGA
jgi:glyoxylase I family protein